MDASCTGGAGSAMDASCTGENEKQFSAETEEEDENYIAKKSQKPRIAIQSESEEEPQADRQWHRRREYVTPPKQQDSPRDSRGTYRRGYRRGSRKKRDSKKNGSPVDRDEHRMCKRTHI